MYPDVKIEGSYLYICVSYLLMALWLTCPPPPHSVEPYKTIVQKDIVPMLWFTNL